MKRFDFESLDVYHVSLDFVVLADQVAQSLPKEWSDLAKQLRRAAASTTLNICEGAGEWQKPEKARFYRYSRRSGTECAGAIGIAEKLKLASPEVTEPARETLWKLVSMLVGLIRVHSVDDGRDRAGA